MADQYLPVLIVGFVLMAVGTMVLGVTVLGTKSVSSRWTEAGTPAEDGELLYVGPWKRCIIDATANECFKCFDRKVNLENKPDEIDPAEHSVRVFITIGFMCAVAGAIPAFCTVCPCMLPRCTEKLTTCALLVLTVASVFTSVLAAFVWEIGTNQEKYVVDTWKDKPGVTEDNLYTVGMCLYLIWFAAALIGAGGTMIFVYGRDFYIRSDMIVPDNDCCGPRPCRRGEEDIGW